VVDEILAAMRSYYPMQIALRIIFALCYTIVYAISALIAAGAGHGTIIFIFPLLTWIFYILAFLILDKLGRNGFYVLIGLHYSFLLLLMYGLAKSGLDRNDRMYWNENPVFVLFTVTLYLAGQAVAWRAFLKSSQEVVTTRPSNLNI
jgi:hypothetical protein